MENRTKSEFYVWATTNVETFLSYISAVKINKINVADYTAHDFCDLHLSSPLNAMHSALITTVSCLILQSSWLYQEHNHHLQDQV